MKTSRWLALDSTRGLAVLGMVLVVSPGSWGHRLSWLDHAAWNGWTPADMVMPLFLFCVGLALGMKASSPQFDGFDLSKVFFRTLALFGIGLALNWIEEFWAYHCHSIDVALWFELLPHERRRLRIRSLRRTHL